MGFFSKFFGSVSPLPSKKQEEVSEYNQADNESNLPIDELFVFNFKKNGGKFLYCENETELKDQLENVLAENDWFESNALCYDEKLYPLLDENNIAYTASQNPIFFMSSCENLIANEGSILFSSLQIKQHKPNELPSNIIIVAKTSKIISSKGDGLSAIRNKYTGNYPTNITAMKYFEKSLEEDFTQYGSVPKNLYLLLLEDL